MAKTSSSTKTSASVAALFSSLEIMELPLGTTDSGQSSALCASCGWLEAQDTPEQARAMYFAHVFQAHNDIFVAECNHFNLPAGKVQKWVTKQASVVVAEPINTPAVEEAPAPAPEAQPESVVTLAPAATIEEEIVSISEILTAIRESINSFKDDSVLKAALAKRDEHVEREHQIDTIAKEVYETYLLAVEMRDNITASLKDAIDQTTKYPMLESVFKPAIDGYTARVQDLQTKIMLLETGKPSLFARGKRLFVAAPPKPKPVIVSPEAKRKQWLEEKQAVLGQLVTGQRRVWDGSREVWILDCIGRKVVNELENVYKSAVAADPTLQKGMVKDQARPIVVEKMVPEILREYVLTTTNIEGETVELDIQPTVEQLLKLYTRYQKFASEMRRDGKTPTYAEISVAKADRLRNIGLLEESQYPSLTSLKAMAYVTGGYGKKSNSGGGNTLGAAIEVARSNSNKADGETEMPRHEVEDLDALRKKAAQAARKGRK